MLAFPGLTGQVACRESETLDCVYMALELLASCDTVSRLNELSLTDIIGLFMLVSYLC